MLPFPPLSALSPRHSVDNRQRTGSLTQQFSCSAVCNEMTFLLYHIYGGIGLLPLSSRIFDIIFTDRKYFLGCPDCSRHPSAPVIATLHNSWQNYGRKLAHNYAHSKVILNVYSVAFLRLKSYWLDFEFY